ncbi:MAG: universal stress protein [Candidatus Omnitrophota bacterium]
MIKKILVELDDTPISDSVITYAVALAKAHDAELTGVTVVDVGKLEDVGPVPLGAASYANQLRDDRIVKTEKEILKRTSLFTSACEAAGVTFHVDHEKGDPFTIMISKARHHDLILIGLGGLFDYGVVKESSYLLERLIREGVQPIFAIPSHYQPIKRVLIAYSGSLHSAEAMKQFLQFRLWPEAIIRIICFDKNSEESSRILADGLSFCQTHGFSADTIHFPGNDPDILLQHAKEWNADLIVLGSNLRNIFLKKVFCDVTHHLIQHSKKALFLSQ